MKQEKYHFKNVTQTRSVIKHILTSIPHAPSCLLLTVTTKRLTLIHEKSFNEHRYYCVIFTLDRIISVYNHDQTRLAEQGP